MIKLIAFDLDDTLAELGKGVIPEDLEKLKILEHREIEIAVCSGKTVDYLSGFMRQVELRKPILIGENGAVIQFGVDLPPKRYYTQTYSIAGRNSICLLREKIKEALPTIWCQPDLVGFTPFFSNKQERETIQCIIDTWLPSLKDIKVYRHVDSYDIVPEGIDKKSSMERLGTMLHITPSEVIAVGNGENDYPMFEYAGFAIGINIPDPLKTDVNFRNLSETLDFLLDYI